MFHQQSLDAKYKLYYENSKEHQDMRQVAGYLKIKKSMIFSKVQIIIENYRLHLIIYPTLDKDKELKIF